MAPVICVLDGRSGLVGTTEQSNARILGEKEKGEII